MSCLPFIGLSVPLKCKCLLDIASILKIKIDMSSNGRLMIPAYLMDTIRVGAFHDLLQGRDCRKKTNTCAELGKHWVYGAKITKTRYRKKGYRLVTTFKMLTQIATL